MIHPPDNLRLRSDGTLYCADGRDVQQILVEWYAENKFRRPAKVNIVKRKMLQQCYLMVQKCLLNLRKKRFTMPYRRALIEVVLGRKDTGNLTTTEMFRLGFATMEQKNEAYRRVLEEENAT